MSNKINLDLLADTSQAQKAISDLTRDVDKLQKKAASTQFKSAPTSSQATKENTTRQVANAKAAKGQLGKGLDTSALKSAFASLTGQLGSFAGGLTNAASSLNTLADTAILVNQSLQAMKAASKALRNARNRAEREGERYMGKISDIPTETGRGRERLARITAMRQTFQKRMEGDFSGVRYPLTEQEKVRAQAYAANQHRRAVLAERREIMQGVWRDTYGPRNTTGEHLTPSQRWNRGKLQMSGGRVAGNALSPAGYAVKGGKLAGLGNMALAGAAFTGQSFANVGRGVGRVVGGLGNMAIGAGRGIASGIGALGRGAMAALANPYVAGAAAGVATVAAPFVAAGAYANKQVDKGRQKAEDLTDLETQFKNLSKNIAGVEVDALSEDLQKLSIDGVVPVQELSKGASMLMGAFKGNQKETSKWTKILADMSAGTGQSVDYFAELITKANQFGTVEFEVFNQLNEKGIPIIDQLKGKFGDTRQEIMKAAEEGKITAAEFMKAFEAAHKASMEGANLRKAADSRMDIQKQTQQYEELEAANVTRGYDDYLMDYDKERRDRAKRRSEDENIIASSEALGSALGWLAEKCRIAGDWISDGFEWAMHGMADLFGGDDSAAVDTQDKMVTEANNLLFDAMEDNAKSEGVESAILKLEQNIERLNKQAAHDGFNDETRARAKDRAEYLSGIIETLEKRAKELAKKEDKRRAEAAAEEARREREVSRQKASEKYEKFKIKEPETEEDFLKLAGYNTYSKLDNQIKWLQKRLEEGDADEKEFEEMERLYKIREEIDKIRKQLAKEAEDARKEAEKEKKEAEKRAEEERKKKLKRDDYDLENKVNSYSERRSAEEQIKYHKEAEKLRKKGYSETSISRKLANKDLVTTPDKDYASQYKLTYERERQKMKELGFTDEQIQERITKYKKDDLYSARGRLAENEEKIKQEEDNIKRAKMVGKEGIENAWGSVERMVTSFSSPYEQNSLKELKDINKNLKSEISAIKGINTKSKAE